MEKEQRDTIKESAANLKARGIYTRDILYSELADALMDIIHANDQTWGGIGHNAKRIKELEHENAKLRHRVDRMEEELSELLSLAEGEER